MKYQVTVLSLLVFLLPLTVAARQGSHSGQRPAPVTDEDFYDSGHPPEARVLLGKNLFFDKILSGNLNISCATCHHPLADTGDGLSLPVGEGGSGLGVTRDTGGLVTPVPERVPRNAPPVFNLGASHFSVMFHDGRIEIDHSQASGFASPAGADLPPGLDNVLAVQAMFPVTSGAEMAGQLGENDQANAAHFGDLVGVWEIIADKLRDEAAYLPLFIDAYPDDITHAGDITYVHAANAIAAFEASAWRFDNSPYDRYLRNDNHAMSPEAMRGLRVFNGKGGCVGCHSGAFQTDNGFHAIAMPQIGPGKGDGIDGLDDFGREQVSQNPADRYRFRTPTLRNISLTAPYGHSGAYDTLEAVVLHHLDPVSALRDYDHNQVTMPSRPDLDAHDFSLMSDPSRRNAIAAASELEPVHLSERELSDLVAFLRALTDPDAVDLRKDTPGSVPSGIPLAD